jgi:large subunit ribosomal protein L25
MEQQLHFEPRDTQGKGAARKLRKAGKIPGILYGFKEPPMAFAVEPRALTRTVQASGLGRNTVLRVNGLSRSVLALLKDVQVDPLSHELVHVDLVEVRETVDVAVDVPLTFDGKPVGTVKGGMLQPITRSLRVYAKPLSIPRSISIDVSSLDLNESVHVSDVQLPEGLRHAMPGHTAVIVLVAPEAAEEKTETAAAAAAPAKADPKAAAAKPAAKPAADKKK